MRAYAREEFVAGLTTRLKTISKVLVAFKQTANTGTTVRSG